MKDYSEFIKSEYGFITNLDIEGKEVVVTTSKTKKGKPHKYPATKENIKHFFDRVKKQYLLLIGNKDKVLESKVSKFKIVYKIGLGLILVPVIGGLILSSASVSAGLITVISGITLGLSTIISGTIAIKHYKKMFNEEIATYQEFILNDQEIEQLATQDQNIISYADEITKRNIEENRQLVQAGKIETVFNINLMDKMSLKELKAMLSRYQISKRLQEEQYFSMPEQKDKKRALVPQSNHQTKNQKK